MGKPIYVPIVITVDGRQGEATVKGMVNVFDQLDDAGRATGDSIGGGLKNAFLQLDESSKKSSSGLRSCFAQMDADTLSYARNMGNHFTQYFGAAFFAELAHNAAYSFVNTLRSEIETSIQSAADLQQKVANATTIKPEIDSSQVYKELREMQTRIPQTSEQLADSLYDTFSSINVSQAEGLALVEKFGKGATAAITDAQTFGTAVIGVMNAYGQTVEDVDHIQDVFFNTVKNGVVTGAELANNLGVVTQAGKNAGATFDELGALISGITKEGGSAAQNINNLANFLQKLPTNEAQKGLRELKVETQDANKNFLPIVDILGQLKTKLDSLPPAVRAAKLQEIFPDAQARTGAQTLLSQLNFIKDALVENETQAGAFGAAYEKMAGTYEVATKLQENATRNFQQAIGELIITNPALVESTKIVTDQINAQTAAIKDSNSETATFTNDLITRYARIKAEFLPFMAFLKNSVQAVAYALLTVVSVVVGSVVRLVELVVNTIRDSLTLLPNLLIDAYNKIVSVSESTGLKPALEVASGMPLKQVERFAPANTDFGSRRIFDNAVAASKVVVEAHERMKKAGIEGAAASQRIDAEIKRVGALEKNTSGLKELRDEISRLRTQENLARAAELAKDVREGGLNSEAAGGKSKGKTVVDDAEKFSLSEFKQINQLFKQATGRNLPVSAYGQSAYHNRIGLDHSRAVDVPLAPSSADGQTLRRILEQIGVPFRAITQADIARGVKATGEHFHIGSPSHAFGKNTQSMKVSRELSDDLVVIKNADGSIHSLVQKSVLQNLQANIKESLGRMPVENNPTELKGVESLTRQLNVFEQARKAVDDQFEEQARALVIREATFAGEVSDVWRRAAYERANAGMNATIAVQEAEAKLFNLRESNANQELVSLRRNLQVVNERLNATQQASDLEDALAVSRAQNADAEFVALRRNNLVRSERLELERAIAAQQDEAATMGENAAQRYELAHLQATNQVQRADIEANESMIRSRIMLADKTVYHAAQANAKVLEFLSSQKGVTDIVADAQIGLIQNTFDHFDSFLDRVIPKMHGFGSILKQIISDLFKMAASQQLAKLFGLANDKESASSANEQGGFSLSSIFGSIKNLFGGGDRNSGGGFLSKLLGFGSNGAQPSPLTGGFSGGASPAAPLLNGANSLTAANVLAASGGLFGMGAGVSAATVGAAGTAAGVSSGGAAAAALSGGTASTGAAAGGLSLSSLAAFASNPITLAVAAAAVGGFMLWRHFRNGTEKKLREAIKQEYAVSVRDMKLLTQIKQIGESSFGKGQVSKHLLETIRLEPSKELIAAYAEQTGQGNNKLTLNKQYADPTFVANNFVRRINGGIIGGQTRGFDHVPVLADGGEFVLRSAVTSREGVGSLEALNQGEARVVSNNVWKRAIDKLRAKAKEKAESEGSSAPTQITRSSRSSNQSSLGGNTIPPSLLAALVAELARTNEINDRWEQVDEGALVERGAKKNYLAIGEANAKALQRSTTLRVQQAENLGIRN